MSRPTRDDVPDRYRFDLTRIYPAPDDWATACEAFHEEITALETDASTAIGGVDDLLG